MDVVGSYLIISSQGIHYYFIVLLDVQLNEYIDIARDSDIQPRLLAKIKSKKYAPIFLRKEDYKIPASNWDIILHPIKKKNEYFYCVISDIQ